MQFRVVKRRVELQWTAILAHYGTAVRYGREGQYSTEYGTGCCASSQLSTAALSAINSILMITQLAC